jgi:hypothetical protein
VCVCLDACVERIQTNKKSVDPILT